MEVLLYCPVGDTRFIIRSIFNNTEFVVESSLNFANIVIVDINKKIIYRKKPFTEIDYNNFDEGIVIRVSERQRPVLVLDRIRTKQIELFETTGTPRKVYRLPDDKDMILDNIRKLLYRKLHEKFNIMPGINIIFD